jgi:tetratricopeptide (TPR) repeat protein
MMDAGVAELSAAEEIMGDVPAMDMAGTDEMEDEDGDALPSWLRDDVGVDVIEEEAEADVVAGVGDQATGLTDWLNEAALDAEADAEVDLPDWLRMEEEDASEDVDLPDWLRGEEGVAEAESDLPDWLTGSEERDTALEEDLPDWLSSEDVDVAEADEGDLPDWLSGVDTEVAEADEELPDWLRDEEESFAETGGDLPDWLQEEEEEDVALPEWMRGEGETISPVEDEELPDWLQEEGGSSGADEDLPDWLRGEEGGTVAEQAGMAVAGSGEISDAYDRGLRAYEEDRLEDAISSFRRVIELDPNHVEAHNYLGSVYFLAERPNDAISALRRAVELDPSYTESYLNLGLVYKETGNSREAAEMFRRYLSMAPEGDSTAAYVQELLGEME